MASFMLPGGCLDSLFHGLFVMADLVREDVVSTIADRM